MKRERSEDLLSLENKVHKRDADSNSQPSLVRQLNKPNIHPLNDAPSSLINRVKDFLPKIHTANLEIQNVDQPTSIVEFINDEEEEEEGSGHEVTEPYIQMNLALGIFEEQKKKKKKQKIVISEVSNTDDLSSNDDSENEEEEESAENEEEEDTVAVGHGELTELRIPREESAFTAKQREREELTTKQRFENLIDAVFDSEDFLSHCSSSKTEEAEEYLAPKKTTKK